MIRKKIGIFIGSLDGGGAEKVVLNLSNEFNNRGVEFVLILRFKSGSYFNQLNSNIKILTLNTNNPFVLIHRLICTCKKNNVDILFSIARYNNVIALIANLFLRKKIVIREANTFDDFFQKEELLIKRIKKNILLRLIRILYPKANKIIANSQDTARDIKNQANLPIDKIVVIHNPLVNAKIRGLSNEKVNNNVFINATSPKIISVGRLQSQKNYPYLLRSYKLVKKTFPDASLIILGKGEKMGELIKLAEYLKIENDVHFLGFKNNPYKYLKNSDLFVLSSLYEGFGNVIVEALAVGLPVVSTNCSGGPKEILDNGLYGELVPTNDEVEFAKAIIRSLNSDHKPERSIERSNYFSIDKITDQYLEILL